MAKRNYNAEAFKVEKTCKICAASFESGMNDPDQGCCVDCRHFLNEISEHPSGPSIKATLFSKLEMIKESYEKRISNAHARPYDYVSGPLKREAEALKKQIEQLNGECGSMSKEILDLKWEKIMEGVVRGQLQKKIAELESAVYKGILLDEMKFQYFCKNLLSALGISSSRNNPYATEMYNFFCSNEQWLRQLLMGYVR